MAQSESRRLRREYQRRMAKQTEAFKKRFAIAAKEKAIEALKEYEANAEDK